MAEYCQKCGEEAIAFLKQCPRCGLCLCEDCWGIREDETCLECSEKE